MANLNNKEGLISSPGRICLFGEHQDYLGLPVIPMAIDRRLFLHYLINYGKSRVRFSSDTFSLIEDIEHNAIDRLSSSPYDHIKGVFKFYKNSLSKRALPSELKINSNIPIKSGLSSSAALIVSTVFLVANIILKNNLTLNQIADVAYQVEHDILGISCGRMDQTSSALGGIFHMTTSGSLDLTPLNLPENSIFVIGDSEISRQADTPLKYVQRDISELLDILGYPNLLTFEDTSFTNRKLTNHHIRLIRGIIGVRDNVKQAFKELKSPKVDLKRIGALLDEQHMYLKDNYKVSHPKIDKMCKVAKEDGALGAKITGAGFGGCMFALTDSVTSARKVRDKLAKYGKSFIVKSSEGVKIESATNFSF